MKDVPWIFWLGVASVLGGLFTRFGLRDYPGAPRPGSFLEFASVCFLMAIVLALWEIGNFLKAQCGATKEEPAQQTEPPAAETPSEEA